MRVTNNSGIPLALAVWLLADDYDYINAPNYISVTTLMRPLRQIIIPRRIPVQERSSPDVADFIARKLGNAIHDSIDAAWTNKHESGLKLLGFSDDVISNILINPTKEELDANPNSIPIYLEQRHYRKITVDGVEWTVGGKFDGIYDGIVNDTKSTSAYGWLYGTRDEEHIIQGSQYRWIDAGQDYQKITEDFMQVNYVFTDWQRAAAKSNPAYPQKRLESKTYPLWDLDKTERWIRNKIKLIQDNHSKNEMELPECTDEELWRSEPKFSYYANPDKTDGRSTKNFDSLAEANAHKAAAGKGVVITKPSEPKRCREYCDAFSHCTQKDRYFSA